MSQLSDVRKAIAEQIEASTLAGKVNVHAYPRKDFQLPAVLILPATDTYIAYHQTFDPAGGVGRKMTVNLIARVFVPERGSAESGAQFLDELLSSGSDEYKSIADAIERTGSDFYTIDGAVASAHCTEAGNWQQGVLNDREDTPVISADIPIVVHIQRS